MHARRPAVEAADAGTTMLELIVVMSIAGTLMAVGMFSFTGWQSTAQHQGSAEELVSTLRGASTRAVSEGRTYCVELKSDTRTYQLYRSACSGPTAVAVDGARTSQQTAVSYAASVTNPSPAPACPGTSRCLYFYPRGTALPAQVVVGSTRRTKTYTVRVEGLTSRVYL